MRRAMYSTGIAGLVLLLSLQGSAVRAQQGLNVFDSPSFWNQVPAAVGARDAWKQGEKAARMNPDHLVVYDNGQLYGYAAGKPPTEQDAAVRSRLDQAYAQRTEMRNIQRTGIFAFNDFDCTALAAYERIPADMGQCQTVKFSSKFSGVQQDQVFSIVSLGAENVCACLKALDKSTQGDNSGIFYGGIARNEMNRLYQKGDGDELLAFFEKNYKRRIFRAPEILMAAEHYANKEATAEALPLLKILTGVFAAGLTSEQYELCGDLYHKLGQEQEAENAYLNAGRLLNR